MDTLSPLQRAILNEDVDEVNGLVANGLCAGVNDGLTLEQANQLSAMERFAEMEFERGQTPLMLAIMTLNSVELTRMILSCPNVNVNQKDNGESYTALDYAVMTNQVELAQMILNDNRCDPAVGEYLLLHLTIERDDLPMFELLVTNPKIDINAYHATEEDYRIYGTALHMCVIEQKIPFLRLLLAQPSINVNVADESHAGMTPLQQAVEEAITPVPQRRLLSRLILQMLLSRPDIDVNVRKQGNFVATPLLLAINGEQVDVVTALLQHPAIQVNPLNEHEQAKNIPLLAAVKTRNVNIVRALLEQGRGLDVNVLDNEENGALHICINKNLDDIFDLLLADARINVNAGAMDNNPLLYAILRTRGRMFEALLRRGADVCNHADIYALARTVRTRNVDGAAIFDIVRRRIGSCSDPEQDVQLGDNVELGDNPEILSVVEDEPRASRFDAEILDESE